MKLKKLLALIVGVLFWTTIVEAAVDKKDHPVIKPLPGSILEDMEFKDFSAFTFSFEENGKWKEKTVKGKHWFFYYEIKKERDVSKLEIIENYKQAALEKGGKILKEGDTKLIFTVPLPDGRTIWTHLHTWVSSYELNIIEEKGFKKKLTFGAEEMKKELDKTGHVAIYGIYFDLDKSTLKMGSEKVLMEMVKLMKNYPDLKIEIQGHTDTTGTRQYNLKLSDGRAETVRSFLTIYGIESKRMTTKGYGPNKPVASNETEEGRSLNRRVELKKL